MVMVNRSCSNSAFNVKSSSISVSYSSLKKIVFINQLDMPIFETLLTQEKVM